MLAGIGTQRDTPEFRDTMHREQVAATAHVKELMQRIRAANAYPSASSGSMMQELASQFDREFRRFQRVNSSMDQKAVRVIDAVKQSRKSGGPPRAVAAQYDEEDPLNTQSQRTYSNGESDAYGQHQQQDQALDIQFVQYDVAEIEQRTQEIRAIEQDMLDVNEMYKDLSVSTATNDQRPERQMRLHSDCSTHPRHSSFASLCVSIRDSVCFTQAMGA